MSIVSARETARDRQQMYSGLPPRGIAEKKPRLLVVGWQGPPFNGRVHVVSSLTKPPFTERFAFTLYDTRMRNARGGSRPDVSLLRSAVQQVTNLKGSVTECQPDAAVFFTGPGPAFWRDLLLLRTLHQINVPVIIRLFGGVLTENLRDMPPALREFAVRQFGRARAILVETNQMVAGLAELCPAVPGYRVANFIHVDDLPTTDAAQPAHGDPFRVIYMGNMTPTKGVETILRSVDQTVAAVGNSCRIEFHFIGGELEPGYLEAFRKRCTELRYAARITVHGKLPRADAHAIAATGRIFAFPTCWPGEGQPAALIEAMGMGLVPIATKWRGTTEIIRHGENGILLDSPQAEDGLSRAILTMVHAPMERRRLSAAARTHIAEEFDAAPALEQFSQILKKVMGNTNEPSWR